MFDHDYITCSTNANININNVRQIVHKKHRKVPKQQQNTLPNVAKKLKVEKKNKENQFANNNRKKGQTQKQNKLKRTEIKI